METKQTAKTLAIAGAIVFAFSLIGLYLPGPWLLHGATVSGDHAICTSMLGMIAQGMSIQLTNDCSYISNAYWGLIMTAIIGLGTAVWMGWIALRGRVS